jgi:hypothetical protein
MLAEADFVGSVTEVAVTLMLPPAGTADGAVYVVDTPLPVVAELKEPQAELPQIADHCTWGLPEGSFEMRALSGIDSLVGRVAGTVGLISIEIGGSISILAETDLVGSVPEVAVTVMFVPAAMPPGEV